MTEEQAREELTNIAGDPPALAMFVWERGGWRQFAIMDAAAAHHSLTAARREGSRIIAVTPANRVWGASRPADAEGSK